MEVNFLDQALSIIAVAVMHVLMYCESEARILVIILLLVLAGVPSAFLVGHGALLADLLGWRQ